jgi:hypothetical protein
MGGGHFGGEGFGRGFEGSHFAERGHFDHDRGFGRDRRFDRDRRFAHLRFGPAWDYGYYDYGCSDSYGYPYYTYYPNNCYPPGY